MSSATNATSPTANGGAATVGSAVQNCPPAATTTPAATTPAAALAAGQTPPVGASPPTDTNPIADAAYKMEGTSTKNIPGTDNGKEGCAAAVSMMFKQGTGQDILPGQPMVLGTGTLYDGLSKDPRFTKVPLADAQPGDIVVTARGDQAGHTGIVGYDDQIISNSSHGFKDDPSTAGTIQQNYTIDSWSSITKRNPDETAAFHYNGDGG